MAVTLLLLLAMVVVGFLSLAAASVRQAGHRGAAAEARANARLALLLAMGELQKELGPDQRVNALAGGLSDDGGASSAAGVGRAHWVGVYDAWNSVDLESRPAPTFRRWLVSGRAEGLEELDFAKAAEAEDAVLWQGVAGDGADGVLAPRVEMKGGAYAWWVGDENAKALIGPTDEAAGLAGAHQSLQAPGAAGFRLHGDFSGVAREAAETERVATAGSLDLLAGVDGSSERLFHDYTVFSQGVLSDVARGGLRGDLSLFLDHPVSTPLRAKLPNTDRLYQRGSTWEELWLFHNAWRALEPPVAGLASRTGGDLGDTPMLITAPGSGAASITGLREDPYSIYKLPSFIRTQWVLSMWAEAQNTEPVTYKLHWVTDGILTLWNPYDVPIALHPEAYISYKFWNIPYTIRLYDESDRLVSDDNFVHASGSGHSFTMCFGTAANPYWGRYGESDPVVLMPGEVLIMSEGPGNGAPIPYSSNQANRTLGMKAGWNLGRGRSRPVRLKDGVSITDETGLRFEIVPNGDTAYSDNLVNFHYYYGGDARGSGPPTSEREHLGGRWVTPADRSRATAHEEVFQPLEGELPMAGLMTGGGKHPFMIFSHQMKTEESEMPWSRLNNPRNSNQKFSELDGMEQAMSGSEIVVRSLSGSQDSHLPQFSLAQENRGLFGDSYEDLQRGQERVVTLSIPREPPLSLGAFQHALANGHTQRMTGGQALVPRGGNAAPEVSHAISNSYALPVIAPQSRQNSDFTDHSYEVNRVLWDSWFLSGITQREAPHHAEKRSAAGLYEEFLADPAGHPLPNPAMRLWRRGDGQTKSEELFGAGGALQNGAEDRSAASLLVEGAFNVNSTSVEAWKALLGSLAGAPLPVSGDADEPATLEAHREEGAAAAALLTAFGTDGNRDGAAFTADGIGDGSDTRQWRGYRRFEEAELTTLAEEIVREVRRRGPFLSLADFVNRRLGSDKELALRGPLQAALDRTVNAGLLSTAGRVGQVPAGVSLPFPEAAETAKSLNTPAFVQQADVLTPLGSRLAARSDTFRIRGYGEAKDEAGVVVARAWCEAVVQRVPDYLDPADAPEACADPDGREVATLSS
ncbi:MAG: hypothetical protein ACQKBY_01030, partial [Verrucomicrobiales bacterium]